MQVLSLRERNRDRTRRELQDAALGLFAVHGFASTTVEQIAAAAGVSTRTFFRYFPTKEDAVFDEPAALVGRLRAALGEADPSQSIVQRVGTAILAVQNPGGNPEHEVTRARLVAEVPSVRARLYRIAEALEETVADFLVEELGPEAEADARIAAGALFGALRGARRAAGELPGQDPRQLVQNALDLVEHGMMARRDPAGRLAGAGGDRSKEETSV